MRTRIKICGVTSVDIAAYAVQCGADAIGLNFYPGSSRYIDTDLGVAISRNMAPFVSRVGVFANADREFIISVVDRVELDYLQFHGDESVQFCTSFDRPYVKAIRVSDDTDTDSIAAEFSSASAILLDTFSPGAYGGTGEPFNWEHATMNSTAPVILAGGLNPENVRLAIQRVSPYAVDVSSGVESDGAKDPEKIQKFCQNVYTLYSN